jgi:putative ABC transport system ATP-binding protein
VDKQNNPLIILKDVCKTYPSPCGPFIALDHINLQLWPAELVAVVGKSGSGKSTLMNVITGIDSVSSGEIRIGDSDVHQLHPRDMARWRGNTIGIVFQFFQLMPALNILENIMLPMDFCNRFPTRERRDRAFSLLEKLGIAEQANKLPQALSGGQQQRAAVARALANDPPILVADEPTGNLDSDTADNLMQLFASLVAGGKTLLMVTHERDYNHYFHRTINIADGKIADHRNFSTSTKTTREASEHA